MVYAESAMDAGLTSDWISMSKGVGCLNGCAMVAPLSNSLLRNKNFGRIETSRKPLPSIHRFQFRKLNQTCFSWSANAIGPDDDRPQLKTVSTCALKLSVLRASIFSNMDQQERREVLVSFANFISSPHIVALDRSFRNGIHHGRKQSLDWIVITNWGCRVSIAAKCFLYSFPVSVKKLSETFPEDKRVASHFYLLLALFTEDVKSFTFSERARSATLKLICRCPAHLQLKSESRERCLRQVRDWSSWSGVGKRTSVAVSISFNVLAEELFDLASEVRHSFLFDSVFTTTFFCKSNPWVALRGICPALGRFVAASLNRRKRFGFWHDKLISEM